MHAPLPAPTTDERRTAIAEVDVDEVLITARLDLACNFELLGGPPAVMFGSLERLEAWARANDWRVDRIGRRSPNSARRVWSGRDDHHLVYDQVWVRASFRRYREAFREHIALRFTGHPPNSLHADHICNTAILKSNHAHAWVQLFPVPSEANSPFGGTFENAAPDLGAEVTSVCLTPLMTLKLWCGASPHDVDELEKVMHDIRGQISQDIPATRDHCDQMERMARATLVLKRRSRPAPQRSRARLPSPPRR